MTTYQFLVDYSCQDFKGIINFASYLSIDELHSDFSTKKVQQEVDSVSECKTEQCDPKYRKQ